MSLINLRHLPKNSFISLIIPYIQTYHNEFGLISEKNIIFKNNKFNLNTKSSYNYTISELYKTTVFYTHIISSIDNQIYNIHERITIKGSSTNNYLNYSVNIINNKPIIYSIKCIEQPLSFNLMNHYTEDIKQIYTSLNK